MNFAANILINTLRDKRIERYIKFNESKLSAQKSKNGKIVLIELGSYFTGTIALSYFTRIWYEKGFSLVGYIPTMHHKFRSKIIHSILSRISIDNGKNYPYRLARSIGIRGFLSVKPGRKEKNNIKSRARAIMKLSKADILKYEVNGVRVGDLFYDWHLRNRKQVTLDFNNRMLFKDLCYFLKYYNYWDLKLDNECISIIVITHSVYLQGVPARIALNRDIEVLLISYDRVNRLSKQLMHSDLEYKLYDPKSMEQLGHKIVLERAKVSFANDYLTSSNSLRIPGIVSGFSGVERVVILNPLMKPTVLIAPHCFTDAPHSLGDFMFNDYWEWLIHICDLSKEIDYDWYIKPHPAFTHYEQSSFNKLLERYPNITRIESSVSNKSIFSQGLDAVITVQGSIGFEAAMFDIISICCSRNIPTQNYNFSLCAESKEDLKKLIEMVVLLKSKTSFKQNELYHFYDLHNLRKNITWLFKSEGEKFFAKLKSYYEIFQSPEVFNIWIDEFYSEEIDQNRKAEARKFLETSKYLLEIDLTKT
jgi:hypothetical protein